MFFGLFVGTLCLVGLARTVMGHRAGYAGWGGAHWRHYGGCQTDDAHASGPAFFGGSHRFRHRHRGRPGFHVIQSMMDRLEVTPAQERAIMNAVDQVRRAARDLRGEADQARDELARALREPVLDQAAVAAARQRVQTASDRIGDGIAAALSEIHALLDDRQRQMLGDVIASAWSGRW